MHKNDEPKHGPHNVGRKVTWRNSSCNNGVELAITEWFQGCGDGSEPHKVGVYIAKSPDGDECFVRYKDFLPNEDGHARAVWIG